MSSRTKTNNNKKMSFFIIGDWNAKVGSQEISRITGKFDLGVHNETGHRPAEFCQANTHSKHSLSTIQETALHIDITRWSILKSDYYILCNQR